MQIGVPLFVHTVFAFVLLQNKLAHMVGYKTATSFLFTRTLSRGRSPLDKVINNQTNVFLKYHFFEKKYYLCTEIIANKSNI